MDMDRSAMLLYLQNVRDLEVAKHKINAMFTNEKQGYLKRKESYPTSIKVTATETVDKHWFPFGYLLLWLFCIGIAILNRVEGGSGLVGGILLLPSICFFLKIIIAFSDHRFDVKYCKEQNEKAQKEREMAQIQVRKNAAAIQKLDSNWNTRNAWFAREYKTVTGLLKQFYSMNILPSQYRNLSSVCYIYDYMSTSQASFEETLIHEHMENGIQRLESRLDEIIYRIEDVVYETRCMRAENRQAVERIISQNNRMLNQLQQIESNTHNAALYAELASDYSKANAYFNLASYLKS